MEHIIKDIEELRTLASREEGCDCYVKLNFGLRSSKHITYDDKWYILHLSDDSEQCLTDNELATDTNIVEAIEQNALILDD